MWLGTLIQATLFRLLLMGLVTIAVFRMAQPYAFGGTTLLDFSLAQKFRDNMAQISLLISGGADYPPGHQWTSRTPFVFPFVNMVVWGLGVPLGLTAWAGWALAALQVVLGLTRVPGSARRRPSVRICCPWPGSVGCSSGKDCSTSSRCAICCPSIRCWRSWRPGCCGIWWRRLEAGSEKLEARSWKPATRSQESGVRSRAGSGDRSREAGVRTSGGGPTPTSNLQPSASKLRYLAYALMAAVTVLTMLWGWGFLSIYRRPLSRIEASRWIYANVPKGKVIANEHWDDGLPMRVEGKDGFGTWGYKGLSSSSDGSMQMYSEDVPEKRELLYRWLNEADYLVLSSNRLWGSIPRLPMRYPMTTLYYKLLFEGKLGFRQVGHFTSFPTVFGIPFNDTGAEEAFSVYDHPEVYIFEKTPEYSEALARSYFDPIDLEHTLQMWPKQISAAPTALQFTPEEAQRQQAGGTWREIFDENSPINRSPALSALAWLVMIWLLGLIAFPIAFMVLRGLSDRGYGVSKTLGILLLAWLSWIGPSLKLAPYQRWWIALALGLLIVIAVVIIWRRWAAIGEFVRQRRSLLLTEEAIFLALFLLFMLIRIGNPDLWHPARGGEKPMDFAYLNAIIKSTTFPPYDPWQSGGFMSYYYFGFVIVGTLIKLLGIVPWVAYNLVVPTLFALTGVGAFAVVYSLVEGDARDTVTTGQGDTVTEDKATR